MMPVSTLMTLLKNKMGKLIIRHQGESHEYLINTRLECNVVDNIINDILKWFPSDAEVDFIELW